MMKFAGGLKNAMANRLVYAVPAVEKDIGMLRINFPGYSGEESLEEISWDEFFDKFDEKGLALVYQDKTADGTTSRFSKLVDRNDAEAGKSHQSRG